MKTTLRARVRVANHHQRTSISGERNILEALFIASAKPAPNKKLLGQLSNDHYFFYIYRFKKNALAQSYSPRHRFHAVISVPIRLLRPSHQLIVSIH